MAVHNTKQQILDAALELFSVNGYDGVSVKDIAWAVGIKDSSLYKHFRSKREIFNALLEGMNRRYDEAVSYYNLPQGEIEQVARQYGENDLNWLKTAVEAIFLFFVQDPYASKFAHLLMIEQYKNNDAARLFNEWFMRTPLEFQSTLFERMIHEGYFREADPMAMAIQFYGPILLLIMLYDADPDKLDEATRLLHIHVEQFAANYQAI